MQEAAVQYSCEGDHLWKQGSCHAGESYLLLPSPDGPWVGGGAGPEAVGPPLPQLSPPQLSVRIISILASYYPYIFWNVLASYIYKQFFQVGVWWSPLTGSMSHLCRKGLPSTGPRIPSGAPTKPLLLIFTLSMLARAVGRLASAASGQGQRRRGRDGSAKLTGKPGLRAEPWCGGEISSPFKSICYPYFLPTCPC